MENSKFILIDSRYKNYGSNSNFKIYLNKPITIKKYIKIHYLYLPRLNYMINDNNKLIEITFSDNKKISIVFNKQNYSPLLLTTYINTYVNNYKNFNCYYNQFTYKIEFYCDIGFSIDFSKSSFHKLLSLDRKIYSSDNLNKFISNCINFNTPSYININIGNISNDVLQGSNDSHQVNFIVPITNTNFGDIIEFKETFNKDFKMVVDNKTLTYLDIIITDDDGLIFENNEANFYMVLEYN